MTRAAAASPRAGTQGIRRCVGCRRGHLQAAAAGPPRAANLSSATGEFVLGARRARAHARALGTRPRCGRARLRCPPLSLLAAAAIVWLRSQAGMYMPCGKRVLDLYIGTRTLARPNRSNILPLNQPSHTASCIPRPSSPTRSSCTRARGACAAVRGRKTAGQWSSCGLRLSGEVHGVQAEPAGGEHRAQHLRGKRSQLVGSTEPSV